MKTHLRKRPYISAADLHRFQRLTEAIEQMYARRWSYHDARNESRVRLADRAVERLFNLRWSLIIRCLGPSGFDSYRREMDAHSTRRQRICAARKRLREQRAAA